MSNNSNNESKVSKDFPKSRYFTNNHSQTSSCDLSSLYERAEISIDSISQSESTIDMYAKTNLNYGLCPYCGEKSFKVHSKYNRVITDLPILGKQVILHIQTRKFFCKNPMCGKKTFAEQPGNEVFRYRRRTRRCEIMVVGHGLLCSSNKAKRLIRTVGIPLSNTTILRDIHRMSINPRDSVKNIGVDDWAFRKGITYGSIIVDMDVGCVIDLLEDRVKESFKSWLLKHPDISLVSRDRSTDYSSAISSSGMNITEVADRFHLVKNMSDCLTKIISDHYADYRSMVRENKESNSNLEQPLTPIEKKVIPINGTFTDSRQIMFNEVKELQLKGLKINKIATTLGIARQTVRKYMMTDTLLPRKSKNRNKYYKIDSYVENEYKCGKSMSEIYREVKSEGFHGSRTPFYDHYKHLIDSHRGIIAKKIAEMMKKQMGNEIVDNREPLMPIRTISFIANKCIYGKKTNDKEKNFIIEMLRLGWFKEIYTAAKNFYHIIKGNDATAIKNWIAVYEKSSIGKIRTFVYGIKMDIKAVKNSIVFNVSNGIVEGFVNKLKEVKRSMYGRAKIELLKRKLVLDKIFFN
jgi:transposase